MRLKTLGSVFIRGVGGLCALLLVGMQPAIASKAEGYQDPFVAGMQNYAKESGMKSVATYADEVTQRVRAEGYIGPELPIPALKEVTDGVYTITGALMWATKENFGLNNNISFVVFKDGVMVYNAGPNPVVAYSAHKQIKRVTNKPVKWVVIENNQGHANLGASYWWDVGVRQIYSQQFATEDFNKAFDRGVERGVLRGDVALYAPARNMTAKYTTFKDKATIDVGGGETVELRYFGEAHTRGSTVAYVPSRKLLFTGDLGYADRMIAVFPYTNTHDWMGAFERMRAYAGEDALVIPGHGGPSSMQKVAEDTYDYLKYMRDESLKLIRAGKGVESAVEIDQSQFAWRPVYAQTHEGNARKIFNDVLKHLPKADDVKK
ncbi:MBL fold metallo-hydrolase [Thiomicrorhabdus sp. zzn3]|uniref:MBL fold metallo-hydrolase n=1 Tax=Thiomicrorhabdus sp. zzn3 TaxID=3039775 RepID=UPI0024365083|nr:MBL fold metallo-hydrolase [Thiomicrorhabdus sp. zzn3]MDG6778980.1 MBL fold metallo-hydrolase [Thiomicrorhabdus sp. zzn3]